jgi:anaerobic ribonucleoside-triphosphate reductase activating protein
MSNAHELQLYARIAGTYTLGPGFRYAIWVQGCPFRCIGCMTPDSQPFQGGEILSVDALATSILNTDNLEGLTVSGGEPFTQAEGLALLIRKVRQQRDVGVIVYTGYTLSHLHNKANNDKGIAELLRQTDLLIDGLYVERYNTGEPLRGSSNQQLQQLTDRYQTAMTIYEPNQARQVEIHLTERTAMLVGIPSIQQTALWQGFTKENL